MIASWWVWIRIAVLVVVLGTSRAARAEGDDPLGSIGVQTHGFVSQGFMLTTRNNYLARSKRGSAEFSEIGINFTAPVSERLRLGVQLFSRDLGPIGNYELKADWFYLDYRFADWLGFRAGRIKVPFGLYNEINDVDSARVPILLPQSIYPTQNRDFLLAQTGGEIYGRLDVGEAGALDYRAYGGTIYADIEPAPGSPTRIEDLQVPYVVGGRLLWEAPLEGLRLGGSVQVLRFDTVISTAAGTFDLSLRPAVLWVASLEYTFDDLLLATEYSRWHLRGRASIPEPSLNRTTVSERAYVMAAYRVSDWLQPGAYYSIYFPNVDDRKGREAQQHDLASTLRFDVNPHWLFKLEGHYMVGTAGLSPTLNEGRPVATLTRRWVAVFVKTTAYF